jgi:peptidoglycan hydrolase-like protein with peptidoglycan-binding domain
LTTNLSALGNRAKTVTIAGALLLAMLQTAAPAAARSMSLAGTAPLHQGAGMAGKPSVRALAVQRALRQAGYHLGAPGADGRFGPLTAAAVRRLQARAGLAVDAIVGASTRRLLGAVVARADLREGVGMGPRPSVRVRRLQRTLERGGFDVGPPGADGRFGPLTAIAVRRMQNHYGLTPDAIVGSTTRRAISLIADGKGGRRDRTNDRAAGARRPAPQRAVGKPRPAAPRTRRASSLRKPTEPVRSDPPSRVQRAPERRATIKTTPQRTNGPDTTAFTLIALLAALLAAAALMSTVLSRRRWADPHVGQTGRDVHLEGPSDDPDTGGSRGFGLGAPVPAECAGRGSDVARRPSRLTAGEPVIGYVAVDHDDAEVGSSAMHDAVRRIEVICAAAEWDLHEVIRDEVGGSMLGRPGLTLALDKIAADQARALVVSDSRQLTTSLSDLAALLEWFRDVKAALILDDLELDTTTPEGRQTASTLIAMSARESESASGGRDTAPRPRHFSRGGTRR